MARTFFHVLALAALSTRYAAAVPRPAEVSLAIPLFSGLPTVSSTILGVSPQSQTTYELLKGFTNDRSSGQATATLIEGPNHLFFTEAISTSDLTFNMGFDCSLSGGAAVCLDADTSTTATATLSLATFVADIALLLASGTSAGPAQTNKPNLSTGLRVSVAPASAFAGRNTCVQVGQLRIHQLEAPECGDTQRSIHKTFVTPTVSGPVKPSPGVGRYLWATYCLLATSLGFKSPTQQGNIRVKKLKVFAFRVLGYSLERFFNQRERLQPNRDQNGGEVGDFQTSASEILPDLKIT
ncbi:hypothetical protein B0H10DRAFT_2196554 [Mycena sp. CBHHK59/15]|nr:hypothetical protein B0H10DRAFT_2196554 [Mycena sp. CBHHK59/15]